MNEPCPDLNEAQAELLAQQAEDDALVAAYEAMYGACELETTGTDPYYNVDRY